MPTTIRFRNVRARSTIAAGLLIAFALSACQATAGRQAAATPDPARSTDSRWRCDGLGRDEPGLDEPGLGELDLDARFEAGRVVLSYSGKHLELPQALSASGARYADTAGNEFWNKGRDARFTLESGETLQCKEVARVPPRDS